MNIQTAITLEGQKYIFEPTKYDSTSEACENCALQELCHDIEGATLCDDLGIARFNTYNFRRATEAEQKALTGEANTIPADLYCRLQKLGIIPNEVRDMNVGASDYSKHLIQPWAIWQDYNLNPWDADIVKRILRTKQGDSRRLDYEKIIHICEERIRQIDMED